MKISIEKKVEHRIPKNRIGLFFEDINYAADGGLYAEMIENRSFEFLKAAGKAGEYFVEYDGLYGWAPYPDDKNIQLKCVMGSPLAEENPHYLRVTAKKEFTGFSNQAYRGVFLKKQMGYDVNFYARSVDYQGTIQVQIVKNGRVYESVDANVDPSCEKRYNGFQKYHCEIFAKEKVEGALFVILLSEPGIVEFDFISMFPKDAVAGIFREDLFALLKELQPGFIRFPGGCIVEGNTLENRYRYKETLKDPFRRKNNWNRWAVHDTKEENGFETEYSHYNQTLGLGYYEYFLLCELLGAEPLPVLNVGFACQYISEERVDIQSPEFQTYLEDAVDLLEFANGDIHTKWGAVRAKMGHPEPFGLRMIGIGNEQWQTEKADFFERYCIFEETIHKIDPDIRLIGSAGPDITSEKYRQAWNFYRSMKEKDPFAYAIDEHYYVEPKWMFDHVDFYDSYPRSTKVFAGEYAAHTKWWGMNHPESNSLEAALAEAAFLTGIERNSDLVVLASYAPLFGRVGYAQWCPNLIWFDEQSAYRTPSYYVQSAFRAYSGDVTLKTEHSPKAIDGVYYSLSYSTEEDCIILKLVNRNESNVSITLDLREKEWKEKKKYWAQVLSHENLEAYNSIEKKEMVKPYILDGNLDEKIVLPAYSFVVVKIT